jgi:hypothetical protein
VDPGNFFRYEQSIPSLEASSSKNRMSEWVDAHLNKTRHLIASLECWLYSIPCKIFFHNIRKIVWYFYALSNVTDSIFPFRGLDMMVQVFFPVKGNPWWGFMAQIFYCVNNMVSWV